MYKRLLTATALLFSAKICALSCSDPVTISDPQEDVSNYTMSCYVNSQGDAAVTWCSAHQKKEAVTIAYKTLDSSWTLPEVISNDENFVFWSGCSIRKNGELCAAWKGENFHVQFREKKEGGSWTDVMQSDASFTTPLFDLQFDTSGQLVAIGSTKPGWRTYPRVAIFKQAAGSQAKQEDATLDGSAQTVTPLMLATSENGAAYACWISNKRFSRALMAQKIENDRFVAEAEIVCELKENIDPNLVNMSINKEGDCVISYVEAKERNGMILTKYQDAWSKPFLFVKKEEGFSHIQLAVDKDGNIMTACAIEVGGMSYIKTVYKHFGRPWQTPVLLCRPNADRWTLEVKSDEKGNFVMMWKEEMHKRAAIFGTTFSTVERAWSDPLRLSPENLSCANASFAFWAPGKGYIFWEANANSFDTEIQVAELSN